MKIEVLTAGLLSSVQDSGRYGHGAIGIGSSGAMDPVCLRLANALVGNPATAAAVEISLSGPTLRFSADGVIALTGATIAAQLDGSPIAGWRPVQVREGSLLRLGATRDGARTYLAISGGIEVPPILGSRSTDLHAGLGMDGGRSLRAGDRLPIGLTRPGQVRSASGSWSLDPRGWFDAARVAPLRLLTGTHYPQLTDSSRRALTGTEFRLGVDSNRVGVRLDGALLHLTTALELCSTGVVAGTVQLPPAGQPIVLMAEHPTTGGYPRIAHLISVDLPHLAQRRGGDAVRFVLTDLASAQAALLRREQALRRVEHEIHHRLLE